VKFYKKDMAQNSIILFIGFAILTTTGYSQEIPVKDSLQDNNQKDFSCVFSCWGLDPDSTIRPLKLNSKYIGRVFIMAEIDTNIMRFKNYEFLGVRLKSKDNLEDSIEIWGNTKAGNYKYFESIKEKIIEHVQYLRIKRILYNSCDNNLRWRIPIKIE
jgi:hypothetical protein